MSTVDYIYNVHHVARDLDRSLVVRCPHCQDVLGIEGSELDEVQGEQYQCHRCNGWFEVDSDAYMVKGDLPANKGDPDA